MMNYNMMNWSGGGGMMAFGWLTYILITAVLILSIAALWKYISKK